LIAPPTKLSGAVRSLKSLTSKIRRSLRSESTKPLPSCSSSSHPKESKGAHACTHR
jgi:hypothetical protein